MAAPATANAGQFREALKATAAHDLIDGAVQLHQSSCRPSISGDAKAVLILKLEDISHLAQFIRDDCVYSDWSEINSVERGPRTFRGI